MTWRIDKASTKLHLPPLETRVVLPTVYSKKRRHASEDGVSPEWKRHCRRRDGRHKLRQTRDHVLPSGWYSEQMLCTVMEQDARWEFGRTPPGFNHLLSDEDVKRRPWCAYLAIGLNYDVSLAKSSSLIPRCTGHCASAIFPTNTSNIILRRFTDAFPVRVATQQRAVEPREVTRCSAPSAISRSGLSAASEQQRNPTESSNSCRAYELR